MATIFGRLDRYKNVVNRELVEKAIAAFGLLATWKIYIAVTGGLNDLDPDRAERLARDAYRDVLLDRETSAARARRPATNRFGSSLIERSGKVAIPGFFVSLAISSRYGCSPAGVKGAGRHPYKVCAGLLRGRDFASALNFQMRPGQSVRRGGTLGTAPWGRRSGGRLVKANLMR